MPFKDKDRRREWERSPEQVEKERERKRRERERAEQLHRLVVIAEIGERCGHFRFCGPKIRKELEERREEVDAFRKARDAEATEMLVDGQRVNGA